MNKIVYDLDGTLVKSNTFKTWILISLFFALLTLNFKDFFCISRLIIERVIGGKDRLSFKRSLLLLQDNKKRWSFVGDVYSYVLYKFLIRRELFSIINKGDSICLATAAPDIYVTPLSKRLSFINCVICTYVKDGEMVEVFSEKKKELVLKVFDKKPSVLYTDHSDDIPLSLVCDKVIFVNPKIKCLEKIRKETNLVNYEVIK